MNDGSAPLTGDEWRALADIEQELCRDTDLRRAFARATRRGHRALREVLRQVGWGTLLVVGTVLLVGGLVASALELAAGGFVAMALGLDELAHHSRHLHVQQRHPSARPRIT